MPKVKKADKAAALRALDGIIEIAKNEQLCQGQYITGVVDEKLAKEGAICGGRQACLYGSLWISAGYRRMNSKGILAGIEPSRRNRFMSNKPELKIASDALNEAALNRIKRLSEVERRELGDDYTSYPAEAYFESSIVRLDDSEDYYNAKADPKKIISLVRSAKKIAEAM